MTISAYTGLPGHGKSYGVVENVIIPALKMKRVVYTNIPMNHEACLNDFGMVPIPFSMDDIIKNPNWFRDVFQAGSLIVMDELWRLWPSGLKANAVQESHKEFLAEHRHLVGESGHSTEIYFVTQDLSQIASFARSLVETTFRVTKLNSLGLSRGYRVDVYFGAVTGARPNPKNREREIFGKFTKEIYKYYKSHTKSETGGAGDETRVDKRYGVMGRLSIKVGVAAVVLILVFIYFGSQKVYKGFHPEPKHVEQITQKSDVVNSQQIQNSAAVTAPATVVSAPAVPSFLSRARSLFVGYSLGRGSNVEHYFVVRFDDYEVTLTANDLKTLGYALVTISDCVVRVTGSDYSGFFMCAKHGEKKEGFFSGIADDVTAPVQKDI